MLHIDPDYYMQPLEKDAESYALQEFRTLYDQLKAWGLEDPEAERKGDKVQSKLDRKELFAVITYGEDYETILLWKSKAKGELLDELQISSESDDLFLDFAKEKYLDDLWKKTGKIAAIDHRDFLDYVQNNKFHLQLEYNALVKDRRLNVMRPVFSITADQDVRNNQLEKKDQFISIRTSNDRPNHDEDIGLSM